MGSALPKCPLQLPRVCREQHEWEILHQSQGTQLSLSLCSSCSTPQVSGSRSKEPARALPASSEWAAEADAYTDEHLFPNISFISLSHEIFLSEYSLHVENRRQFFFFIRHIRL